MPYLTPMASTAYSPLLNGESRYGPRQAAEINPPDDDRRISLIPQPVAWVRLVLTRKKIHHAQEHAFVSSHKKVVVQALPISCPAPACPF
jgi:hypothetical protein